MDYNERSTLLRLRQWMTSLGFNPPDSLLQVAVFPDTGRGLMAVRDIEEGETIISIPKIFLITTETALSTSLGSLIKAFNERLSPVQLLCVFLMVEKGRGCESTWKSYVDVLPIHYSNPAYYPSSHVHFFAPYVQKKIIKQKMHVKLEYEKIRPFLKFIQEPLQLTDEDLDFRRFRWALFTVNTRCVFMELPKSPILNHERNCSALAPFLDLFNHSCDTQVHAGFNPDTNSYVIKTLVKILKNEQVFINYGFHDNVTLLMEYGFVLPINIHSSVRFTFDDVFRALEEQEGHENVLKQLARCEGTIGKDLCCTWDGPSGDLYTFLSRCKFGDVSMEKVLNNLCRHKLGKLEEEESPKQKKPTYSSQMAFALIAEQKSILRHVCELFNSEGSIPR